MTVNLNKISIAFPNGNEKIFGRQLEISWDKPQMPSYEELKAKEIEVFFTDNYIDDQKTSWSRIARVPYSSDRFIWGMGDRFRSDKCRVAVRVVDLSGRRTKMSKSANNFSIFRSIPKTPSVVSPVRGSNHSNSISIILDYQDVLNSSSARDRIFIYYRSLSRNVPLTSIIERVPVGTGPMSWDVSDLPNADDYEIIMFSSDDYGNRSNEVIIGDISISNEGYFIRDFFPPEGYMMINDGESYTSTPRIRTKLFIYEESTGIHGIKFSELSSIPPYDEIATTSPQIYSEDMITNLSGIDGREILTAIIQDFGGNRTDPQPGGLFAPLAGMKNFRSLLGFNSPLEVVDILLVPSSGEGEGEGPSSGSIYFITRGERMSLFEISSVNVGEYYEIASLPIEANLMVSFLGAIYMSGVSSLRNFNLLRYDGSFVNVIHTLSDVESEISAMKSMGSILYIGCLNGDLYKFDGASLSFEATLDGPPGFMSSISSRLYILIRNSNSMYIHDGTSITKLDIESNTIG